MIFDIFILVLLFGFVCIGNGCLIFFLWWIIGQPHPVDHSTATFTQGRVFSSIGRKLCDWYMAFGAKEEQRIMDMLAEQDHQTTEDRQIAYYDLSRTHRRANPAKAFGVCPVCMGTYVTLLVNGTLVILLGIVHSWMWAGIVAVPVIVYGWALSLAVLKNLFLTE